MMKIIDGKKIRDDMLSKIKREVLDLPFRPVFCDVLVGEDLVSKQYIKMKSKYAEKAGISFYDASFPSSISTEKLVEEIKRINNIENICGIIIQLPLPDSFDSKIILDAIDPSLDVDCLGNKNSERFYNNESNLGLPTALACMEILNSLNIDLKNKKIVILGQGELVGKPVASLLRFAGFEPIIVDSKTKNKEEFIKQADVIISGMGNGKYITGNMIKNGVVIIDAGTSESGASVVGDVDLDSVANKASFVSPVPGGVGPVTVAMLLNNVLQVAKAKAKS
ncbi:MAG TPA: bifunctional 5,10-methylenetetrahydrofolate dehydrogenase/5,10-methenyltetrahydrofolate cyclohydrolase [Candidatus Paceibacterota bacterium]|nr:bifunctional 5,10-methylenetetrahydrofolate dehydrogenase/5,10-methenyltetrahydrofolate cyclohydrolase [Candidatus Paceibacterota bacterium]HPT18386.1 bifunctional 5,10-methylenetetrahydrofolate dehydrogenase/5,10-methenyltetrahydrofolate cyclohydrolase [Candidatus Paceibacterota bacterium]